MKDRNAFVKALAVFLAGNQAEMSILLQLGRAEGERWRELRRATPLAGYPTVEQAEQELREFLWPEKEGR